MWLQDCLKYHLGRFEELELETYSSIVICYINSYVGSITVDRHVRVYPNPKSSMTEMLPIGLTMLLYIGL